MNISKTLTYTVRLATGGGSPWYYIDNPKYPGKPQFTSRLNRNSFKTGSLLANRRGFSFKMDPPFACFKALRAHYNAGVGKLAEQTIHEKARSWITPDFIFDGVCLYSYPTRQRYQSREYNKILDQLRDEFKTSEKIPIATWDVARDRIPQSTSPGLPYILEHITKKHEALERDYMKMRRFWWRTGHGLKTEGLPDCAAFARSHIGAPGSNKVRPVWAYPVSAILAEAKFALPIISELTSQRIGHHTAYGMEMMRGGMAWINDQALKLNCKSPGVLYAMTDYTSFDTTVPAWLIRDCFQILKEKFDFSKELHSDGEVYDASPNENIRIYNKLVSYFINTPIRNPDGRRFRKDHGIPSGSMFTNIIGTMVNFIVTRLACKVAFDEVPIFDVYFGDDALIALPSLTKYNLERYADVVDQIFGMKINKDKSYTTNLSTNIHFLGYYNYHGSPFKKDVELSASLLFPQHMKDDWSYTVSRCLGVLLASGGCNKNIHQVALGVYNMAKEHPGAIEEGIELLKSNPRMKRHISILGCEDLHISREYFENYELCMPRMNCMKIQNRIDLTKDIYNDRDANLRYSEIT